MGINNENNKKVLIITDKGLDTEHLMNPEKFKEEFIDVELHTTYSDESALFLIDKNKYDLIVYYNSGKKKVTHNEYFTEKNQKKPAETLKFLNGLNTRKSGRYSGEHQRFGNMRYGIIDKKMAETTQIIVITDNNNEKIYNTTKNLYDNHLINNFSDVLDAKFTIEHHLKKNQ